MDIIRRRSMLISVGGEQEQWDIELYKDPSTGHINGGAYSCVAGQVWHVEWGPLTSGYIIDWRQSSATSTGPNYLSSENASLNGGTKDYIVTKNSNSVKVGQRQWQNSNNCNAEWIKIRITQP